MLSTRFTGPPFATSDVSVWHLRHVSFVDGRSAWSGAGIGFGKVPVMISTSCRVPLIFALTQPVRPGSTWHSAHVTSRWTDMSYALSSGAIVWQRPQKSAVSVHCTATTPPTVIATAKAPPVKATMARPRRLRSGGWGSRERKRPIAPRRPRFGRLRGGSDRRGGDGLPGDGRRDLVARGDGFRRRGSLRVVRGGRRGRLRLGRGRSGEKGLPCAALCAGLGHPPISASAALIFAGSRLPTFIACIVPSAAMKKCEGMPEDPVLRGDVGVGVGDLQRT